MRSMLTFSILAFSTAMPLSAQNTETKRFPFRDPDMPLSARVDDLVSRMNLQEKTGQMLYNAPAIERLGIPAYNWWNEGLHGVARAGRATVFPQAIGLAATWDTSLIYKVATVISDEARAKHHASVRQGRRGIYEGLTFWSPNINIFRDPRWGRGMETYGEDPFLAGRLAVSFVKGLQGNDPKYLKTVATPKHFAVHSGPEPDRHVFDAAVDERDLRETYLPAFRMSIIEGHAQSVMCAYNRFRGLPCCASDELLVKILRNEWGFDGYVVSDCWAIMDFYSTHKVVPSAPAAAAMALRAGTDLNCGVTYDSLGVAVRNGLVDDTSVDISVKRLFRTRFQLGMFDPPERVAYANIPADVNDSKAHRALALDAARRSIVLLKNDRGLLPLSKSLRAIAVIGPNADDVETLLGNYNGTPTDPVTPLAGIRRKVSPATRVMYAPGCDVAENTPSLTTIPASALFTTSTLETNGLRGEYFDNYSFTAPARISRVDSTIGFNWWEGSPAGPVQADSFSVRWTGVLAPPVSGRYALGARAIGRCRIVLNDSVIIEVNDRHVVLTQWKYVILQARTPRMIVVEFQDRRADAVVELVWQVPDALQKEKAMAAAREADATIMMLGLSPRLEGEEMPVQVPGFHGGDRVDIGLPSAQEELLKEVVAVGKPVVLVLLNGSALSIAWAAEHVPAVVEAWYPGQAAGPAIADVVFGDWNPSGRLPVTFYGSVDQLPPFSEYSMRGRTYRYFEGDPLFPFGHGLSYTTFTYKNLRVARTIATGRDVEVSVDIQNTGKYGGDEVAQVYISNVGASVPVPIRSLAGFHVVHLKSGETKTVRFTVTPRQLSVIDKDMKRSVGPGEFTVSVGGKQPGMKGWGDAKTTGVVSGRFRLTGETKLVGEMEN